MAIRTDIETWFCIIQIIDKKIHKESDWMEANKWAKNL